MPLQNNTTPERRNENFIILFLFFLSLFICFNFFPFSSFSPSEAAVLQPLRVSRFRSPACPLILLLLSGDWGGGGVHGEGGGVGGIPFASPPFFHRPLTSDS